MASQKNMAKKLDTDKEKKEEYNVINGQLQNFRTLKVITFKVLISDEKAMSLFDDVSFAKKLVKDQQKKGNKNITYVEKFKGALEVYEGMNKNQITKKILQELKDIGAKIDKK